MSTNPTEIMKGSIIVDIGAAIVGSIIAFYVNKSLSGVAGLNTPVVATGTWSFLQYGSFVSLGIGIALVFFGRSMKFLQWIGVGWLISDLIQILTLSGTIA